MSFAAVEMNDVRPGAMTERSVPVPDFYQPHRDTSVEVKIEGRGTGFRVQDVAPERRWPISMDGTLTSQARFEEMYVRIGKHQPGDYIPAVTDYVARGVDPMQPGRLVRLQRRDVLPPASAPADTSPIVDRAFARSSGLTQVREPITEAARAADAAAAEPEGSSEIVCSDCGFVGKNESSLRVHRRHRHRETEASG